MNKRIAVANDVSGLGNCSMAVNLPIFSIMGLQPCPIPTAVLTNQSCYNVFFNQKCEVEFDEYKKAWHENEVVISGAYSGYFPCGKAVNKFTDCFLKNSDVIYINDPVMGDLGQPYNNCNNKMIEAMKRAVSCAFVTTPNLTELCMLTDVPFQTTVDCKKIEDKLDMVKTMTKTLINSGTSNVVVTGIKDNTSECKGGKLYNVFASENETKVFENDLLAGDFSGTGDIFSSIVAGCVFNGKTIESGVKKATKFIEKAIIFTNQVVGNDPNDGICFQPFLTELSKV